MAPHSSYSCLENPMDGGAWQAAVHGVAEGQKRLSDFTFTSLSPCLNIFCFCQVHIISIVDCAHLCMKCSLVISNFLEEISISHSVVCLYFFALFTQEGFFISPCYSLELPSDRYIFPFLLCFSLLFFSQLFVRPPQTAILLFCISFPWEWS